jgi:hypothetical protein
MGLVGGGTNRPIYSQLLGIASTRAKKRSVSEGHSSIGRRVHRARRPSHFYGGSTRERRSSARRSDLIRYLLADPWSVRIVSIRTSSGANDALSTRFSASQLEKCASASWKGMAATISIQSLSLGMFTVCSAIGQDYRRESPGASSSTNCPVRMISLTKVLPDSPRRIRPSND